ncbi:MAG TPA: anti-sigma regulatory factor [Anaeromyxobacteraceae bacterium]|nr:anti-sigma regulatory factor [Anaeromyxobacteraceae bacterium]
MGVVRQQLLPLRTDGDVVQFRQAVRKWTSELRFSLVEQTKLVTAASELARNTLKHGGGGEGLLEVLEEGPRLALRLTFEDHGPGIADVELAMKDGYTTGGGLGLGLGGAKRLVNDFSISSAPGQGTRVTVLRWK